MEDLKKLPANERDRISIAVGCKPRGRKAEGGRIGFAAGSGMLACIDAKWKNDPKTFLRKTANIVSKGLDKLWGAVSPLFLPAVQVGLGRAEAFKHPTEPDMYWSMILASDAIKRLGLSDVALSQLKNASLLKKADIIGKLILKFPGSKFWKLMANKIGVPGAILTETFQGYKGFTGELDLVKKYAEENNIPYEKAKTAYLFSGSALKGRWDRASMFSKLGFGTMLPKVAYAAKDDPEIQEMGVDIYKYIEENKPIKEVPEEVTKKIELPDMPKRSDYGIEENLQAENQPIGVNRYMQLIK
jgi:hypothetical protein